MVFWSDLQHIPEDRVEAAVRDSFGDGPHGAAGLKRMVGGWTVRCRCGHWTAPPEPWLTYAGAHHETHRVWQIAIQTSLPLLEDYDTP